MKLLIQPRDGVSPLIAAINKARKSIEVVIFRFNRDDIERALARCRRTRRARARAHRPHQSGWGRATAKARAATARAGVRVDRTGDDFIRYHGKFMIVDRTTLLVLGFNYTLVDITRSRSFGIVTKRPQDRAGRRQAVRGRLREAARTWQPERCWSARQTRARNCPPFIGKAKTQLLIYDPKVSDVRIIKLLKERVKAGVDVRIIGKVSSRGDGLVHQKYPGHRLHVRAIVRDGRQAFIGSQSLRRLELDKRREVGLFVTGAPLVKELTATFEYDWARTGPGRERDTHAPQDH